MKIHDIRGIHLIRGNGKESKSMVDEIPFNVQKNPKKSWK